MKARLAIVTVLLVGLFVAPSSAGPAEDPKLVKAIPPGSPVEVVEGQLFSLQVSPGDADTFQTRFSIAGGPTVFTDIFEPYGDFVPTRSLRRRGVLTDVDYTLVATPSRFDGSTQGETRYDFLMHPLPVVSKARIAALILEDRRHLVGLRLLNVSQHYRVKAWGQGFRSLRGRSRLPMRLTRISGSSRTYVIPGGLRWNSFSNPRIKVSVAPPEGAEQHGVPVRGRLLSGRFRTRRNGDTAFRRTDRWTYCTTTLDRDDRPPRRKSCVFYE